MLCALTLACSSSLTLCQQQPEKVPFAQETKEIKPGKLLHLEDLISKGTTFDKIIAKGNVVIDFSATWCPPCQRLVPVLEELAKQNTNVLFVKIDVDKFGPISDRYGVRGIPTMVFFKDGKQIDTTTGFGGKSQVRDKIKSLYK